jgi:hypothetical protein
MQSADSEFAGKAQARVLLGCWLLLLALTAGSFWSAEGGTVLGVGEGRDPMRGFEASRSAVAVVLGLAAIKAQLIAGVFMELFQAPRVWAVGMAVFIVSLASALILVLTW